MFGRHWLFRVSIAANAFVVFYFAIYSTSTNFSTTTAPRDLLTGFSSTDRKYISLQSEDSDIDNEKSKKPDTTQRLENSKDDSLHAFSEFHPPLPISKPAELLSVVPSAKKLMNEADDVLVTFDTQSVNFVKRSDNKELEDDRDKEQFTHVDFESEISGRDSESIKFSQPENTFQTEKLPSKSSNWNPTPSPSASPQKSFPCDDLSPRMYFGQRGPFWVVYNYIQPRRHFRCDESITYTTHADFTFLDNLVPLLERWEGPISLALYTPGSDFQETLRRVIYIRECVNGADLIKDYVNFHFFFEYKHTPKTQISWNPFQSEPVNCSAYSHDDVAFGEGIQTYKKIKKLPYPVNVARNIAREMSTTHYVFPSDIELYPNPNVIPDFLDMIRRNDSPSLQSPNPNKVFVFSIFEVEENVTLPQDKSELVSMLKNKTAIPFHKYVCSNCHRIPKAQEWISHPISQDLKVFHVGKRYKPYQHWEPIFIGTKQDPFYDERLTWEGRSDKMTQGYILCVMDYEFHILDNAFLVHRPGIKRKVSIPWRTPVVARQNSIISKIIFPELKQLFGTKAGCHI